MPRLLYVSCVPPLIWSIWFAGSDPAHPARIRNRGLKVTASGARKAYNSCCQSGPNAKLSSVRSGIGLPGSSPFPTTRWTLVVATGDSHRKAGVGRAISRGPVPVLLLTSLKFFVAGEQDRQRAHRRGWAVVPVEFPSGEERYRREPAHNETPERISERSRARSVLDRVVERLRDEFARHGRRKHSSG